MCRKNPRSTGHNLRFAYAIEVIQTRAGDRDPSDKDRRSDVRIDVREIFEASDDENVDASTSEGVDHFEKKMDAEENEDDDAGEEIEDADVLAFDSGSSRRGENTTGELNYLPTKSTTGVLQGLGTFDPSIKDLLRVGGGKTMSSRSEEAAAESPAATPGPRIAQERRVSGKKLLKKAKREHEQNVLEKEAMRMIKKRVAENSTAEDITLKTSSFELRFRCAETSQTVRLDVTIPFSAAHFLKGYDGEMGGEKKMGVSIACAIPRFEDCVDVPRAPKRCFDFCSKTGAVASTCNRSKDERNLIFASCTRPKVM